MSGDASNQLFFYEEALRLHPQSTDAMLALAQKKMALGAHDESQEMLSRLLELCPEHQQASIMIAELLLLNNKLDAAVVHFQTLLEKDVRLRRRASSSSLY